DAGFVPRDITGAVSLNADVAGTVNAPTGEVKLQVQQLQTPPMDPTEITVDLKAQKTILAMVEAHDARGGLANVNLDVGVSPASLQRRTPCDDVRVKLDGKFGPLDLSRLPIVVGEGRLARRLQGTVAVTVQGRGSLQAPTLTAEARTEQLAAGQTP